MNDPLIIRRNVQLHKKPKVSNGSPECTLITEPQPAQRIPRIARLLALALHYEQLLQQGVVRDYAQLARREQVSRARITQIMNLRLLAPDIPYLLDQMIAVVSASTLVSYALYTLAQETVDRFGTDRFIWTLPLVLYGIFRYLYLVHRKEAGGDPTRVLLSDKPILVTVALWAAAVVTLIYHGNR